MSDKEMQNKEKLEKLELELEELKKVSGGMTEFRRQKVRRYIELWKWYGDPIEKVRAILTKGESPEDVELINQWVDEIYARK